MPGWLDLDSLQVSDILGLEQIALPVDLEQARVAPASHQYDVYAVVASAGCWIGSYATGINHYSLEGICYQLSARSRASTSWASTPAARSRHA